MRKIKLGILILVFLCAGCSAAEKEMLPQDAGKFPFGVFKKDERILILAPHPDDEAIACSGVIQKALRAGAKVRIVYLTNGDHNELAFIVYERRITIRRGEFIRMGKVRQQEAVKAMKFLGLSPKDLVFLGYPDYGTFEIFSKYWQPGKPFRDRLTRISSVPYEDNPTYGLEYVGQNIVADLRDQLLDFRPDKIFVSHPADVNVDHKTLYLFMQVALSDLENKIKPPEIYPYLVHWRGWPKPRHYHPELELEPPDKFKDIIIWLPLKLSPAEVEKKYRAIQFYRSQTMSSAFYLFSFARKNELFSEYPELENGEPVEEGKDIFYSDASEISRRESGQERPEEKGTVSYGRTGDYFVVTLEKPKRSGFRFGVLLYIFGYSKQTPFAQMPKIRIITMGKSCKIFNSKNRIIDPEVVLETPKGQLVIKIPLKLLGNPDYALTALKAYRGPLAADAVVFRKVRLK